MKAVSGFRIEEVDERVTGVLGGPERRSPCECWTASASCGRCGAQRPRLHSHIGVGSDPEPSLGAVHSNWPPAGSGISRAGGLVGAPSPRTHPACLEHPEGVERLPGGDAARGRSAPMACMRSCGTPVSINPPAMPHGGSRIRPGSTASSRASCFPWTHELHLRHVLPAKGISVRRRPGAS